MICADDAAKLTSHRVLPLHKWKVQQAQWRPRLITKLSNNKCEVLLLDRVNLVRPHEVLTTLHRFCKELNATGVLEGPKLSQIIHSGPTNEWQHDAIRSFQKLQVDLLLYTIIIDNAQKCHPMCWPFCMSFGFVSHLSPDPCQVGGKFRAGPCHLIWVAWPPSDVPHGWSLWAMLPRDHGHPLSPWMSSSDWEYSASVVWGMLRGLASWTHRLRRNYSKINSPNNFLCNVIDYTN